MKLNIFLIVLGAALVSLSFAVPQFWCAYFATIGAIGVVNGVFGLCYQRFIYRKTLMIKPTPLPFEAAPKCPKCRHYISSSDVQYNAKKDVLQLKCGYECKYKFTMWPFDRRAERKERDRY